MPTSGGSQAKERMERLVEEIRKANVAYYTSESPIMTDFEYDRKKRELKSLADMFPHVAEEIGAHEVLGAVGAPVDTNDYAPMKHEPPMLSLDNAYTEEDVAEWMARCEAAGAKNFVVTPKLDGLAWEIVYADGKLSDAGTRGDGYVGESLKASAMHIPNIPKEIPAWGKVCVRGEVVLSWKNFETAKELDGTEYANPRNAAAGIARRKVLGPSTPLLSFVAHGLVGENIPPTYSESLNLLREWGFEIPEWQRRAGVAQVMEAIRKVEGERKDARYMCDGAVVRVDENAVYDEMGSTSHHPRAALAFKFAAERAETVLKDVEWTRGKKGKISPNARLETVHLAGTRVSNALLHTIGKIRELDIRIGDVVIVEKAAEIIPQVVGVRRDLRKGDEREIRPPDVCPVCKTPVEMRGEHLYCTNKNCGDAAKNKLLTYVSQIGLRGIGPSTAENLAANGSFSEVPDLYALREEDFIRAGVAPKNAEKIVREIRDSIGRTNARDVLAGLSIDMCGPGTATELLSDGRTIRDLCHKPASWFENISGIGKKTAEVLSAWFCDPENVAVVEKLYAIGAIKDETDRKTSGDLPLSGMKICITGTLSKPRSFFAKLIEENGGTFVDTFSKSVDVLVAGEGAGSKLEKARKANVPVWTEKELFERIR